MPFDARWKRHRLAADDDDDDDDNHMPGRTPSRSAQRLHSLDPAYASDFQASANALVQPVRGKARPARLYPASFRSLDSS
jgi:hypothetical protein